MKREGCVKGGNPSSKCRKDQRLFNSNLCECTERNSTEVYSKVYAASKSVQTYMENRCTDCGLRRVACGLQPSRFKKFHRDKMELPLGRGAKDSRSELKFLIREGKYDAYDGEAELYMPCKRGTRKTEVQSFDIFIGHSGTWIDYGGSATPWDEDQQTLLGVETVPALAWDEQNSLRVETVPALAWDEDQQNSLSVETAKAPAWDEDLQVLLGVETMQARAWDEDQQKSLREEAIPSLAWDEDQQTSLRVEAVPALAWDEDRQKSPRVERIEAPARDEDRQKSLSAEPTQALAWDVDQQKWLSWETVEAPAGDDDQQTSRSAEATTEALTCGETSQRVERTDKGPPQIFHERREVEKLEPEFESWEWVPSMNGSELEDRGNKARASGLELQR